MLVAGRRRRSPAWGWLSALALVLVPPPAAAQTGDIDAVDAEPQRPTPRERVFRYFDDEDAVRIVPGQGIGRLLLGTPLNSVVATFGAPLASERSGVINRRTTLLYRSGPSGFISLRGDRTVEEIGLENVPTITTAQGVGSGMPAHQVAMVYGEPEIDEDGGYRYPQLGIGFSFRAGIVFQVLVFPAEAAD